MAGYRQAGGESQGLSYSGDSAGRFASATVTRDALLWIFGSQVIAILPLFYFLPFWMPLIWAIAVFYRVQVYRGAWPFPGNIIKFCFGAAGVAGLYITYGGSMAVEPMIGFLVLSFLLKLVEVRNRTDVLIVLYIGFVAVGTQLLMSQQIWMSLYSVFCCGVLLAALQSVFQHRKLSVGRQLKAAWSILLKSIPVMLVLFILMPRLGQLWAVPSLKGVGKTGFSDSMSPGDFSNLIQSDDIVFRVSFSGSRLPLPRERYWRGLVFDDFDGYRWQRFGANWSPVTMGAEASTDPHPQWQLQGRDDSGKAVPVAEGQGGYYQYSVFMEPHSYQWLFTLMAPLEAYSPEYRTRFTSQYLLVSDAPVTTRTQYEVVSIPTYVATPVLDTSELRRNLSLPTQGNERARELARQWQAEGLSPQQLVDRALQYYRQSFTYTLQPPRLGENSVDDFLFETRRGFCEHFASSFTFLMRAAGIPARVVVGYQGGEYKSANNYLIVRQSDAHAWAEVWLEGEGWTRVDPTSAVSPLRIERALYEAVDEEEAALVGGALMRLGALSWLATARYHLEEWDYLWQTRVLGYDSERQDGLLTRLLGGNDPWRVAVFFVSATGTLMLIYFVVNLVTTRRQPEPKELRLLRRLLRRLEARDGPRRPGETPRDYCFRIAAAHGHEGDQLKQIIETYYQISYGGDRNLLTQFADNIAKYTKF